MLNIFPLLTSYNLCCATEGREITVKHMAVMVHAGLRGAIAFALALKFPSQHIHVSTPSPIPILDAPCISMGHLTGPIRRD
eukprot:COSAG05_NODE_1170_length_5624_cov_2.536360_1_plen_80_part_10